MGIRNGERYEIPQLMSGQWLRDLAIAVGPLSDVLYNKYINQADDRQWPRNILKLVRS